MVFRPKKELLAPVAAGHDMIHRTRVLGTDNVVVLE
jgi:hypothetical protein